MAAVPVFVRALFGVAALAHLYAVRWYWNEGAWRRDAVVNAYSEESPQDVFEYGADVDRIGQLGVCSLLAALVFTLLAVAGRRWGAAVVRPVAWGLVPVHVYLAVVSGRRAAQFAGGYTEAWFYPQPQTVDQFRGVLVAALTLAAASVTLAVARAAGGPWRRAGVATAVVAVGSAVVVGAAGLAGRRFAEGLPGATLWPFALLVAAVVLALSAAAMFTRTREVSSAPIGKR